MVGNTLEQDEIASIRGVFEQALTDIPARRVEQWLGHWTEDARLMAPDTADVVGHAALQAWLQGRPPVVRFETLDCEVEGSGDLAVLIAHFVRVVRAPDGGEVDQPGRQVLKCRRQPDGRWLIAAAIFNSGG